MRRAGVVLAAALLGMMLSLSPTASRADEPSDAAAPRAAAPADTAATTSSDESCKPRLAEWSLRFAGGLNPENVIQYYALHATFGFPFWQSADRWFSGHGMTARWEMEPWAAYVVDHHGIHQTSSFEIGLSPLFGKILFGDWRLRPFIEGGEGIMYTDLRKQRFGTPINFSSQFGAGLEYEIRPGLDFTFAARIRHMSNAGLASSNPGVNTYFGLVGLTFR
jgi:hypothetical protein